jgi:cytosine deaminase
MEAAIEEARIGFAVGGLPIGSVLVCDGKIIGRGHNQRVQKNSVIHHAEMNCYENTGRIPSEMYLRCTLYTTLSPCQMCSGTTLHYGVPKVIVGENRTIKSCAEDHLIAKGVEVIVYDNADCKALMDAFIAKHNDIWLEDIGNVKIT